MIRCALAAAVLFEGAARPLLVLHAVLGFAAVGAATHLAVYALLALRRRGAAGLRRFAWIAPACALPQFALGLALYPTYRVRVRLQDLDRTAPFVAQLFDFKEHLAAIGLALVVGAAFLARASALEVQARMDREAQRHAADASDEAGALSAGALRPVLAALSTAGAALMWAVALLGVYVTNRHPVGMP